MNVFVVEQSQALLDESILDQILQTPLSGKKGSLQRKDGSLGEHYIINTGIFIQPHSIAHERINQFLQATRMKGNEYLMIITK